MELAVLVGFWAFFVGIFLGERSADRFYERKMEQRLAFEKERWAAEQSLARR